MYCKELKLALVNVFIALHYIFKGKLPPLGYSSQIAAFDQLSDGIEAHHPKALCETWASAGDDTHPSRDW